MAATGHMLWHIESGFPEHKRSAAAHMFWEAFSGKLGKVLAPEAKSLALIERILDRRYCISVSCQQGDLLALAGYKTHFGSFTAGTLSDFTAIYGWFGGPMRALLLNVLERQTEPDVFLLDSLVVRPSARGMGIGSALLKQAEDTARKQGLAKIRLDVIDSNFRARALYERLGFIAVSSEKTGPFADLFGFSSSTTMVKDLSQSPSKSAVDR